jgi:hypothetical protein
MVNPMENQFSHLIPPDGKISACAGIFVKNWQRDKAADEVRRNNLLRRTSFNEITFYAFNFKFPPSYPRYVIEPD